MAAVDGLTIERIHEIWNRVKQGVKMEGQAKTLAILNDVDPHDVRGNLVILATSGQYHYRHINEDSTRLLLETVISGIVNQPVRITCELLNTRAERANRNGSRPQRPGPSPMPTAAPPPAPEPDPAPPVLATVLPISAPVAAPVEAPAPAAGDAEAHVQRIANLFDAEILSDDEAPPFPKP